MKQYQSVVSNGLLAAAVYVGMYADNVSDTVAEMARWLALGYVWFLIVSMALCFTVAIKPLKAAMLDNITKNLKFTYPIRVFGLIAGVLIAAALATADYHVAGICYALGLAWAMLIWNDVNATYERETL